MIRSIRSSFARTASAVVAAAAVTIALPGAARADNNECKDAEQQLKETANAVYVACQAYNKTAKKPVDCEKAADVAEDLQNIIQSIAGVLGIGSKSYSYGSQVSGTIQSITKRLWVSTGALKNDKATVQITHTDGKGKVKVNICRMKYDPKGKPTAGGLTTETIEGSKTFTLTGAKGEMVSVELVGKEASHSFSYKLLVKDGAN